MAHPGFHDDVEKLRGVMDTLREGLQVLSQDWRYLYLNAAAARHGRRRPEELLGRTMLECFPGIEHTPMFARLERCLRDQCTDQIENEFVYADGARAWFELRIQPTPEGLVVLSLDVSERKQLEGALRRADRLTALGQMAAGVAHNLGNILNPLALNLELIARRTRADGSLSGPLDAMRGVLRHGIETVSLLKDFNREATISRVTADLNAIAGETAELCSAAAVRRQPVVEIHVTVGDPPRVPVSPGELLAAVVNLVTNALDALPEGGRIDVRTGHGSDGAWVEVEDDGVGMPEAVQARAFEPFFTTKGDAGTGLGLATVYALVKRHGGEVQLRSGVGAGTSVRLVFPSSAERASGG
ncbi:MAG: PAS domain-containing protein [Deltaproteobacteria bacterium]|nr:PAS domain-containing protein [Deltaproteobacteria bacterium]